MIPDAGLKVWHEKRMENGFLEGSPLGIAWALENLVGKNWSRNVVLGGQGQQR